MARPTHSLNGVTLKNVKNLFSLSFILLSAAFLFSFFSYVQKWARSCWLASSIIIIITNLVCFLLPSFFTSRPFFLSLSHSIEFSYIIFIMRIYFLKCIHMVLSLTHSLTHSNFDFEKRKIFLKFITISCSFALSLSQLHISLSCYKF